MAKLSNGLFGHYSGKIGPLSTYDLNGQQVIRSCPGRSNRPLTIPRKNNCGKMTKFNKFIRQMGPFLKFTFGPEARGTVKNWHNLVTECNHPKVIKGYYPDFRIDYSEVVLSRGSLRQPENPKVEMTEEGLKFSWKVTEDDLRSSDQVIMMVHFPHDDSVVFQTSGAKRSAGFDILPPLRDSQKDKNMEIFISFVSNDRQDFSDSKYLGRIEAGNKQ